MKYLIASLLLISVLTGCVTNSEVPDEITSEVSYQNDIQVIFNNSCGGTACHTNGGNTNGINLSTYATTLASVGTNYGTPLVVPSDADNSPLVDKVKPNPEFGSQMPLGGNKLSSNQIAQIEAWINAGAKDN